MNYDEMTPEELNCVFHEAVLKRKKMNCHWVDEAGSIIRRRDAKPYTTSLHHVWPFVAACEIWNIDKCGPIWTAEVYCDKSYSPTFRSQSLPFALCVCLIKRAKRMATRGDE